MPFERTATAPEVLGLGRTGTPHPAAVTGRGRTRRWQGVGQRGQRAAVPTEPPGERRPRTRRSERRGRTGGPRGPSSSFLPPGPPLTPFLSPDLKFRQKNGTEFPARREVSECGRGSLESKPGPAALHRVPQGLASTHQAAALRASCGAAAVAPKVRALLQAAGLQAWMSPGCNLSLGPCLPSHAEPRPACEPDLRAARSLVRCLGLTAGGGKPPGPGSFLQKPSLDPLGGAGGGRRRLEGPLWGLDPPPL